MTPPGIPCNYPPELDRLELVASDPERLRDLDRRIKKARAAGQEKPAAHSISQAEMGWRMILELVLGIGIGAAIGYGADRLLGTIPVFLMAFTLLGFAAGCRTMLRTAKEVQRKNEAAAQAAKTEAGREAAEKERESHGG